MDPHYYPAIIMCSIPISIMIIIFIIGMIYEFKEMDDKKKKGAILEKLFDNCDTFEGKIQIAIRAHDLYWKHELVNFLTSEYDNMNNNQQQDAINCLSESWETYGTWIEMKAREGNPTAKAKYDLRLSYIRQAAERATKESTITPSHKDPAPMSGPPSCFNCTHRDSAQYFCWNKQSPEYGTTTFCLHDRSCSMWSRRWN